MLALFSRFIEHSPKRTVLIWGIACLLLAMLGFSVGTRTSLPGPTNIETLLENPGEARAIEAGIPPTDALVIVLSHPALDTDTSEFVAVRESLVSILQHQNGPDHRRLFRKVETSGHTMMGDELFVSSNRHAFLIRAETYLPVHQSDILMREIPELLRVWQEEYPEFFLGYLSDGTFNNEMFDLIHRDLDRSLFYTLPITFAVLVLAFGSLAAALIPLLVASISLAASLGVTAVISNLIGPVSATASQLVVLLVLAVGIDYALFFIGRVREERIGAGTVNTAVHAAFAATARAILWSGVIVSISLCGLFLMQDSILASMALVSVLSVLFTVVSSVLIVPCIVVVLGDRLEWGRIRRRPATQLTTSTHHPWLRAALRHPLLATLIGSLLLLSIGQFALHLKLGSTVEPTLMPDALQSYRAFEALRAQFPDYDGVDLSVVMWGEDLRADEESEHFQAFLDGLASFDALRGPLAIDWSDDGTVVRYHYIVKGSANAPSNQSLVHEIREELIPSTVGALNVQTALSGTLPYVVDDVDRYSSRTLIVCTVVLALSFFFLLIAFRSLVIPIKAIILNLFSTVTAFGTLVLVFQMSGFTGFSAPVIESFVPALLFTILFGLSMDYHVFLLSRVTEEYRLCGSVAEAVRQGIIRTFSTITSAALIMISVFLVIASLELPLMRQLGFGLATAILVDATIIRSILLPSAMLLLGKKNWYLPRWLHRMPHLHVH